MSTKDTIILFAIVLLVLGDKYLAKNKPALWKKLQLPYDIVLSGLSLVIVVLMVQSIMDVSVNGVDGGSPAAFFAFTMVFIVALIAANIYQWIRWYKHFRVKPAEKPALKAGEETPEEPDSSSEEEK